MGAGPRPRPRLSEQFLFNFEGPQDEVAAGDPALLSVKRSATATPGRMTPSGKHSIMYAVRALERNRVVARVPLNRVEQALDRITRALKRLGEPAAAQHQRAGDSQGLIPPRVPRRMRPNSTSASSGSILLRLR